MLPLAGCGNDTLSGDATGGVLYTLKVGTLKTIGDVTFTCMGFTIMPKTCAPQYVFISSDNRVELSCSKNPSGMVNFDLKAGGVTNPKNSPLDFSTGHNSWFGKTV